MKPWSAYPIRFLLTALCEKPERLSPQERASAGVVARQLFEFAVAQAPRDAAMLRSGIENVCRTYDSDPVASKALLSNILTPENLQAFGYEDMPILAREAQRLIRTAPDFVRDLYVAAFGFKENDTQQTAMGPGRIMPLTSNRRQDYDHGLWQLGETFPTFLKAAPAFAIEALTAAVTANVGRRGHEGGAEQEFQFRGTTAQIKSDGSYIWEANTQFRQEPHLKMLDAFEAELNRVANEPLLIQVEDQILTAVIERGCLASVWRKVLICGTRNPSGFGKRIPALACSLPILTGLDTSDLAGNFIHAIYPEISAMEREGIENAILSIPATVGAIRRDPAVRIRDRLLGCIPEHLACVNETKNIIAQLKAQGGPPPNRPPFQIGASFGGVYTDTQFLEDHGVPIQAEPNRKIIELASPLKAFVGGHSQVATTPSELDGRLAAAQALHTALLSAPKEGAHEMQIENGWSQLVAFCKCAARCDALDANAAPGQFIRGVLLEAAKHPSPEFNEEWAADFDSHASWSPAPRIDAAEGLMFLAFKPACINPSVVEEIKRLSTDPVPAVRLQIADHLGGLGKTSPDTWMELLSKMAHKDPSSTVVLSLLNRQIHQLAPNNHEEARRLAAVIFERSDLKGDNSAEVRLSCVSLFLDLFLWRDDPESEKLILTFAGDVLQFGHEATRIVAYIREILVAGPVEPPDQMFEKARTRAFNVLTTIMSSIQNGFLSLEQSYKGTPYSNWPKEDQAKVQRAVRLADSIAMQLYFASGAFDAKSNDAQAKPVSVEQKKRLLKESSPLMDLLANDPHPSTVHHLIEMLQSLLYISPREVFLRIGRILKAGKNGGYQRESLAIGEIVNVVTTMLADFRPLLQEDQEVRETMVSILDIFVEAGWPQAIQLTYRLDEIFR